MWNQTAFSADWKQPLGEGLSFNAAFRYYRTRDTGKSLLGNIGNDSWSIQAGLNVGPHGFTVAHTRIDDDSPFDYVWHTWDFFLNTNSQVSDFNNPNERVWMFRYDYDFAALGIPGLALIARYVRGTDIDGSKVRITSYNVCYTKLLRKYSDYRPNIFQHIKGVFLTVVRIRKKEKV